jgi:hypothetical protein
MKYSISLLESDKDIRGAILNALASDLSKTISKSISSISTKIKLLVKNALQNEPEYQSLKNGQLRREFGIENTNNVDVVIAKLIDTLVIDTKAITINSQGLSGGLRITMMPSNFSGVVGSEESVVVDNIRGYSLPWLEWLLLKGSQIIVKDYEVKVGSNPYSRSGDAIMVSSSKNWRVPPEFAGTVTDNWTTRALSTIDDEISKIIQQTIESNT